MPTRRIFAMVAIEFILLEVTFHALVRPWAARVAANSTGVKANVAQSALLVA